VPGFEARTDLYFRIHQPVVWEEDALSFRKRPSFYGRRPKSVITAGLTSSVQVVLAVHVYTAGGREHLRAGGKEVSRPCTASPWCR